MQEKRYVIYRLLNEITGESYVGLTSNFKRREWEHLNQLKRNKHENLHLQHVYNKYGAKAFKWFILEGNLREDQAVEAETKWIAFYDSFHNGYNQTEGGDAVYCAPKPCVWNGIEYPSIIEAARQLGIHPQTMYSRIQKQFTGTDDLQKITHPCTWNGISYPTIADAARELGIPYAALVTRIARGHTCDADLKSFQQGVSCTWNNKEYKSIAKAAMDNGIKPRTLHYWLSKGYTCDDDLKS